jgi:predicted anti-sigma-YlaC factor YlaD
MKLSYSCKQASRLLISREDEGASLATTLKLRFHLLMCTNCTNFSKQVRTLTELLRELPAADQPPASKGKS